MARKSKASRKAEHTEQELKKLDRFAGSSDEGEDSDDNEQQQVDLSKNHNLEKQAFENDAEKEDSEDEDSDNYSGKADSDNSSRNDDDESVDDDDHDSDDGLQITSGMANAMTRILSTKTAQQPVVVLSKTRTKLQIAAAKEKQLKKELRETRRLNRERQLTALHIPLSIATTSTESTAKSAAAVELEQERMHRRVATRGIVALFNAIATHQHNQQQPTAATNDSATTKGKLTKDGFLDMIKKTAAASATEKSHTTAAIVSKKEDSKWNALKDDYMMDSKKNWDEESSEEEEQEAPKKKRHKTRT